VELRSLEQGDDAQWHGNHVSYVPGLNHLSDLFLLWHESQQRSGDAMQQLQTYMNKARSALDHLPPELSWKGVVSGQGSSDFGTSVQTANLYITQLHIRYNLLEQMMELSQKSVGVPRISTSEIYNERKLIVDDILELLRSMPHDILQANGYSLVSKIRDIGAALLEEPFCAEPTSPGASGSLKLLLELLEELEGRM